MRITINKAFNQETNSFEPDLSSIDLSKWEVRGFQLNQDGETYTVNLEWISAIPYSISQLQGKLQLINMGLFDQVHTLVNEGGLQTQIYWNTATNWERDSPILNRLAPEIGMSQEDLDNFFIEASKLR